MMSAKMETDAMWANPSLKSRPLALITLGIGVLLSACAQGPATATGPRAVSPHVLPAQWQQLESHGPAESAAPADARLSALQDQALRANRDIALALKRWERAQQQLGQSQLERGLKPSLSGSAAGSRALEQGALKRSYALNASVSYEVDLWQRLAHGEAAQAAQVAGQRADWAAAQLLIRKRVAESYWSLAALALEEPLIREQLQGAEAVLALTRLRVREGKLLPIEVDKAAISLQGLQSRLAQLSRERSQQTLNLGLLLDELAPSLPESPQLPASQPGDWQPGAPAEVLERRPDVQRARAQVDSALAQWRASEAARYPSLSLSLGVGTGGGHWRDWLDRPVATLSSSLIVPLVDWRRLDLQRAQSVNEVESAALSLRDTVHKALVEVEQLAAERRELRQQALANGARLAEAQQAEKLAALRYELGVIARADWLQARNARLSVEQEAIQLRLRQWLNRLALQMALASG